MTVPRGSYTQIHVSGFGYGDASLETGISQVSAAMNFITDEPGNTKNFDLFLFMN